MKIDNVHIYGLEESIAASGLPMLEDYDANKFSQLVDGVRDASEDTVIQRRLSRAVQLASCAGGESHDCFLCGIIVQFNMTAPRYFFPEFQRYHFADIISSTSTMHKLKAVVQEYRDADPDKKQTIIDQHFSWRTRPETAEWFLDFAADRLDSIEYIKANLPEGWLQTARITTNYRQLKTQYRQRWNHPLQEWKDYCGWIKTLPMADQLLTKGETK